ncbi:FAD/FMN-containing isoamyl alcohol oxidase MreA [Xylariaceae sp. FL1651]|nr:FAD/FMN-containing isoamyl alcohol oxidase MreA [Xylariaceae sp. FL1651]
MKSSTLSFAALAALVPIVAASEDCRCFPGDACWPTEETWSSFNSSVGGKLIRTVPIGSVCHDPQYDEEACEAVKARWMDPDIHIESSHSVQAGLFAHASCDPLAPREAPCVIGSYVQYSVSVESADDISKTIKFANEKNIRLVIRNTAHDYLGKSTGAGAIAIWTQKLRDVSKLTYKDAEYKGDAIKMGAGVSGAEVSAFASNNGLAVVSGNCPSVGPAGGYIQGGGHGPLSSKFGLAADSALEFEVVDGNGKLIVANRKKNSDLFWALRGGGGGTFGVVVSATVKAYPDTPISFGTIMFASAGLEEERFYEACASFYEIIPSLVDAGAVPIFLFTPQAFLMQELIAPGLTEEELDTLLAPFLAKLEGIQYQKTIVPYKNYHDFQAEALAPMTKHQANFIMGGSWLMPRSVITDATEGKKYFETVKELVTSGLIVQQLGFNVAKKPGSDVDNAVLPSWRDTLLHTVVVTMFNPEATIEENQATLAALHNDSIMKLGALAPEAGAYLSEAVPFNVNWKKDFYGANYDKLVSIKDKYDPHHLFYALTGVGGDYWVEQADKRLCKATSSGHKKDEL